MSSRRQFLRNTSIAGIIASVTPHWVSAKDLHQPIDRKKDRILRIAHITDVHVLDKANAVTCFNRVLREINTMKDKPDFIINTGDTVMDENKQTLETVEKRWSVWIRFQKKRTAY